jgi:hypothetical protein
MKNLIKVLAKFENKKKQVAVGNLRETLKVLAAILAVDEVLLYEYNMYLNKFADRLKASKKKFASPKDEVYFLLGKK